MALYSATSRYKLDATGQTATRESTGTVRYTLYTVKEGDNFERISARLFGTTERFWELADINPQIKFPLDISVGDVIRIPV
jgi:nucleoid-associated protein YgaU